MLLALHTVYLKMVLPRVPCLWVGMMDPNSSSDSRGKKKKKVLKIYKKKVHRVSFPFKS